MFVAADTSAVVALSSIERLDLLRHVWSTVWLPRACIVELVTQGENWLQAKQAQTEITKEEWLLPWNGQLECQIPSGKLGKGEIEAVSLAHQEKCECLIDDKKGRAFAESMGVNAIGTFGVLKRCKADGVIAAAKPLICQMQHHGFRCRPEVIAAVLADMNE